MLKKLKLTLLMSGVIFFPKGTYAADQGQDKDEKLRTVASRPTSSSQQPAASFPYATYGSDGRFNTFVPAHLYVPDVHAHPSARPTSSQVDIGSSSEPSSKPTSSSQQADAFLPYVIGRPHSSSASSDRRFNSLLPAFACEPNFDAQLSVGPSNSQADIGSSSSGVDLSADEFEELTARGRTLYAEVLKSNVEINVDLTKYFNAQKREELGEILTIIELLKMDAEKPLQDIEEELQKLTKSFIKLDDQKEIALHLSTVHQLDKMLDDEVPTEDFLLFCSDVLKDPKFQGSNIHSYVNLIQQGMFAKDFFEKVDEVEEFTEATLADLLKETPDNSKNLVERIARPFFKMMNLSKAAMQTFPYENEEEVTFDSSSPYSNGEVSAVSPAPVELVVASPQSIVALASTSQIPFSSSSSLVGSAKTFLTPDDVSFNSTFEIEMGNSIPRGWSLHDGRKGRTGEERTEENPLQVEVIENGKIKIIGDMHNLYYPLPELKDFAGQEMRFSAKVKSTVPGTRLAYIGKRGNQVNSDAHSNREDEEVLNLTFKVDSDQASLNNLYFLGGRAKLGTPPSMEISDVKLERVGEKD